MNKFFVIVAIATTMFISGCSNNSGLTMVTPTISSSKNIKSRIRVGCLTSHR